MTKQYIEELEAAFSSMANDEIAKGQKAYMRDQFEFLGLKSDTRKSLQKEFLIKANLPPKAKLKPIVKTLWKRNHREYQYFAMELLQKFQKQLEENDISLLEHLVVEKSWWDTVDFIAAKSMGAYFKLYPHHRKLHVDKWIQSENIWLQRSALLFQLKYKEELDTELLKYIIEPLLGSSEFFINKAIGWVLREYSKTNPAWVKAYCEVTKLQPLSKKEALRLM